MGHMHNQILPAPHSKLILVQLGMILNTFLLLIKNIEYLSFYLSFIDYGTHSSFGLFFIVSFCRNHSELLTPEGMSFGDNSLLSFPASSSKSGGMSRHYREYVLRLALNCFDKTRSKYKLGNFCPEN